MIKQLLFIEIIFFKGYFQAKYKMQFTNQSKLQTYLLLKFFNIIEVTAKAALIIVSFALDDEGIINYIFVLLYQLLHSLNPNKKAASIFFLRRPFTNSIL